MTSVLGRDVFVQTLLHFFLLAYVASQNNALYANKDGQVAVLALFIVTGLVVVICKGKARDVIIYLFGWIGFIAFIYLIKKYE
jgi:hypothetical protein